MKSHKWGKEIKAWADGAEIECRHRDCQDWMEKKHPEWWDNMEYRIKTKPVQEPVAWIRLWVDGDFEVVPNTLQGAFPVYTHPAPSWQGLSDDEILKECAINFSIKLDKVTQPDIDLCRAIEQALKEKNHART